MADDKCVEAVEGEVTEAGQDTPAPRPVFLVPALDDAQQRQQVLTKVQEFLVTECPESPGVVTYVAQVGWEEAGQVHSLTSHLLSACRAHHLLPSERCILLSLQDQYQAIQLCLARINKQRRGEFMAAASDVLDVWNALYRETVGAGEGEAGSGHQEAEGETETLEELNHLRASQDSHDPVQREIEEVKKAYREFLSDSLCVDHFRVFECVRCLLRDDPALFRKVFCKVYIIEGLEELPLMERALLKLISKDSRVYRVSTELPFPDAAPHSPSALDISGIHETTILQTPCRHEEKQADQTDGVPQGSMDTVSTQTPSQTTERTADDQNEMATPRKRAPTTEEDDSNNMDTTDKIASQEESKDSNKDEQAVTQEEKGECENTTTPTKPSTQEENSNTKNSSTTRNTEKQMKSENDNTNTPAKPATQEEHSNTKTLPTPSNTEKQTKSENDNTLTPEKPRTQPSTMAIQVEGVEETLAEVVDGAPRYPARATVNSESETYVERLFLAHVRLMINTRDELALTLACSMPGREISQQGFTDIRQEAQRKEMPMYQTIVSFILRQRLGGKGYQPEPDNPVLAHSKPLGEFVDALMKLQSTLEAQTDPRQGAARVLCGIKTSLGKMKGCMLKRRMIEAVADHLCAALDQLVEAAERDKNASADKDGSECAKPSKLQPSLKHLIRLCDAAGGQAYGGGVVDALGGDLLTQLSSSKKTTKTPLKVPSVLTLFRSPAVIYEKGEEEEEEDLETRLKRKMGQSVTAPAQPKRFKSACSWAPINMSPIDADKLNLSFSSPIAGPSLKAMGKAAKRPSEDWREIVAEVTQEEESVPTTSKTASPAPKPDKKDNGKPKKSKRSLLKDISNMGTEDEETKSKKKPAVEEKGAKKKKEPKAKKEPKMKPLLKGQRSITSFFKT
ncbi:uncharacterized protein LOC126980390 isoform X2 [Eriocheir sinensis]|nr:uncharacterized protein LOC126980390 isoform X2 [Eriocheir sinensis]XP_050686229.1 uncharacterized protein LOC126980390 isoform X2 [Eriocheir sinensis]